MAIDKNVTGANSVAVNDTAGIRKYFRPGWILLLVLGLFSFAAQADPSRHRDDLSDQYQYKYISLDQFVPEGLVEYIPTSIDDRGRVYGSVKDPADGNHHITVLEDGVMTVYQHGVDAIITSAANKHGTVGGAVDLDTPNFQLQAALFHEDQVEPILPQQPGEVFSLVVALNDRSTAVIESSVLESPDTFVSTLFLYQEGQSTLLNIGLGGVSHLSMNNKGKISGTLGGLFSNAHAFRFDPSTGETEHFYPLPSDSLAWGQDINQRGEVLGYSFNSASRESIGVWDRRGKFKTYFTEGIPEFPTISNRLLYNDENLIVITNVSSPARERGKSYLVPRPGIRWNLADLVVNLPPLEKLSYIEDINKQGSIVGSGSNNFLLERINKRHHRGHH